MASAEDEPQVTDGKSDQVYTSSVWKHFDKDKARKKSTCRLCGIVLSWLGQTTSMKKHLDCIHPSWDKDEPEKPKKTVTQKITSMFHKPITGLQYEQLTKSAVLWCAEDLRPLSIVNGRGFQKFCRSLNPNYRVPSHTTMHNYLMKMYHDAKDNLVKVFDINKPSVALTTDLWTSTAVHGYITVTGHYIDENWTLKTAMLATRRVEERHTGDNIAKVLQDIQAEFKIHSIVSVTTDNAGNMIVAAREANFAHVRCFAHSLQLAINDCFKLPSIEALIAAARRLVRFFSKSVLATQALEDHLKNHNKPIMHLIQDVCTRWNSTYKMFERLQEMRYDVSAVINGNADFAKKKILLTENQWKIIENILPTLHALACATEVLCLEEFPTCSGIYPLIEGLLDTHLAIKEQTESEPGDSPITRQLKTWVSDGLKSRLLSGDYIFTPPIIASVFDPSYKSLLFISESDRKKVYEYVVNLIPTKEEQAQESQSATVVKQEDQPPAKRFKTDIDNKSTKSVLAFLGVKKFINVDEQRNLTAENELQSYLRDTSVDEPLDWWKNNGHRFPNLSKLAKKYLAIPATSVPSERAFSTAGLTITKLRACLDSETVDALVFINKNVRSNAPFSTQVNTSACSESVTQVTQQYMSTINVTEKPALPNIGHVKQERQ